ncbi:MAG: NAD(P)-dependent oxidoreductase [Pseudomonadota bacterium]
MTEIHTLMVNDVPAFVLGAEDYAPLVALGYDIVEHFDTESLLAAADRADHVLTWDFDSGWYSQFPKLKIVFTPAAGDDWARPDPSGRVPVSHGSYHGELMCESVLSAILFMNHRMPQMIRNFARREWDRTTQGESRLLSRQSVLIVGYGHIGEICAEVLTPHVREVIGVRRRPDQSEEAEIRVYGMSELVDLLPLADHVVMLLPGGRDTDQFMNAERLARMKGGAFIYNFGRGNSLTTKDLLPQLDHLGGAFLDVTEEEPLPQDSPLWRQDNVFITPHSSAIFEDYRRLFIEEVCARLGKAGESL